MRILRNLFGAAFAACLVAGGAWAATNTEGAVVSTTLQSAAVANANGTPLKVTGMGTAVLTVNCATCSGGTQVNFEATQDGTNWVSVAGILSTATTPAYATSVTTAGVTVWTFAVSGYQQMRARVSAYSAGTVTVTGTGIALAMRPVVAPAAGAIPVGANPTGTIGNTAVNGSAATFLRSDGAPARGPAAFATGSSTGNVFTAPSGYFVCTAACTVTPPVPAAGYEFCVMNDDNVSSIITLGAIGSSAMYEATARTGYGTAGTGTLTSAGAVGDMVCIVGRDSTHYLTTTFVGTWVAS